MRGDIQRIPEGKRETMEGSKQLWGRGYKSRTPTEIEMPGSLAVLGR